MDAALILVHLCVLIVDGKIKQIHFDVILEYFVTETMYLNHIVFREYEFSKTCLDIGDTTQKTKSSLEYSLPNSLPNTEVTMFSLGNLGGWTILIAWWPDSFTLFHFVQMLSLWINGMFTSDNSMENVERLLAVKSHWYIVGYCHSWWHLEWVFFNQKLKNSLIRSNWIYCISH